MQRLLFILLLFSTSIGLVLDYLLQCSDVLVPKLVSHTVLISRPIPSLLDSDGIEYVLLWRYLLRSVYSYSVNFQGCVLGITYICNEICLGGNLLIPRGGDVVCCPLTINSWMLEHKRVHQLLWTSVVGVLLVA
jgi:hypothetical protein